MASPIRLRVRAFLVSIVSLFCAAQIFAAEGGTGSISGRIFNPATGEYVRNAEISVRGTALTTVSEDDGVYRLTDVPAGEVVITVNFTGYTPAVATLNLSAGQALTRDIELVSTFNPGSATTGKKDEVLKLQAFTVSSEREGNAKAIMEQRNSMNISNSVASDVFGDNAEGDVGDFLRNMPGVDLDLTQGEVRNVRLRGLGPEYNSVTIDGVSLASADANKGAAGDARAFSFEQVSLNSMDSIEVSKTISADTDANAPAGTINLKTKHAYSRAGRRISAQANVTAFHDEFTLGSSYGPDDAKHRKIRPGGILEYSDVFFNHRLGVVVNISESNLYSENARTITTYNFTPTAADPRPVVPTTVAFLHAPRLNRRSTVTLTTDLKVTEHLAVSFNFIYNYALLYNLQRTMTFGAGARTAVVGVTPLTNFTSAANGTATSGPSSVVKPGETYTAVPRFEYRRGNLEIDGRFAGSDSKSWYNPLARKDSVMNAGSPALAGVQFRADRSSLISGDWHIQQIGGPDFGVGNGFTAPTLVANDGRYGRTQLYSGDISAIYKMNTTLPIIWKTGVKEKQEIRDFINDTDSKRYTYTGPGAGTGAWKDINSPYLFDTDAMHASESSISGKTIFIPNLLTIGKLFEEHPEYFTRSLTAANFYTAYVANTRHYKEDIKAGFLMATTTIQRAFFRAGVRWERTETDSLDFNPRSPAEMRAAGFGLAGGIANTIPGVQYQYFSRPRVHRKNDYDDIFPSASFKYRFTRNFDFQLGYSSTIRRPTFSAISGVTVIDDVNLVVNTPNPQLKPEKSDNFAARLAYYFEPVGVFTLDVFENKVKSLQQTDSQTAAEFGYTGDLNLSAYTFNSTFNSENEVTIRGLEAAYSQSLTFLPRPFNGVTVRGSYTRTYADTILPLMSPRGFNAGLNYSLSRYNVFANLNWRDDTPTNVANTLYNRHRATIDVGGGIRLTNRYSLFFTGRNIRSEPVNTMQKNGANPAVAQTYEVTGAIWTFGIKGVW